MGRLRCKELKCYLTGHKAKGELPLPVLRHLESCRDCREEWERWERFYGTLNRNPLYREMPSPSSQAQPQLIQRIREETVPRADGFQRRLKAPYGWATAGVTLLIGAALLVQGLDHDRTARLPATSQRTSGQIRTPFKVDAPPPIVPVRSPHELHSAVVDAQSAPASPWKKRLKRGDALSVTGVTLRLSRTLTLQRGKGSSSPTESFRTAKIVESNNQTAPVDSQTDDLAYLNALPQNVSREMEAEVEGILQRGDDFVTVPRPLLVASPSTATNRLVSQAVRNYEAERAVIDERLFQKVDVELKGGDLKELADLLTRKTGIRFYVGRDMENWKLTVLVKQVPVRDLMRQLVRLFNLQWRRHGEDGAYRYQLVQSLKQRLLEEEMRRRDEDELFLSAVAEVEPYVEALQKPLEELSPPDDAKEKAEKAQSAEEREHWLAEYRTSTLLHSPDSRDALELFHRLSPDSLVALRNGQEIIFSYDGSPGGLPKETAERLRRESQVVLNGNAVNSLPWNQLNATAHVTLDRSQPNQAKLMVHFRLQSQNGGESASTSRSVTLGMGRPRSHEELSNRKIHASLAEDPNYKAKVTLEPRSSLAVLKDADGPALEMLKWVWGKQTHPLEGMPTVEEFPVGIDAWVDSADVFAEIHRKTGRNILADYYLRVYPRKGFQMKDVSLLEALNHTGDKLKTEWQPDGGFLRFRRGDYYTERTLDVPNQWLQKWSASREQKGTLTLDDLSEIAGFSKEVINNHELTQAVLLKWRLMEWPMVRGKMNQLLFYAALDPLQRQQAQSPGGLLLSTLRPHQIERWQTWILGWMVSSYWKERYGLDLQDYSGIRFYTQLHQPDTYHWNPALSDRLIPPGQETIREKTHEKARSVLQQRLKAQSATVAEMESAERHIRGPRTEIWTCFEMGDNFLHYYL